MLRKILLLGNNRRPFEFSSGRLFELPDHRLLQLLLISKQFSRLVDLVHHRVVVFLYHFDVHHCAFVVVFEFVQVALVLFVTVRVDLLANIQNGCLELPQLVLHFVDGWEVNRLFLG